VARAAAELPKTMGRFNRWDTPWINPKLISGLAILLAILLMGLLGRVFWDTELAYTGSAPLNLPPVGFENLRGQPGSWAHPLGTENSGRDMLALILVGSPNTLLIGVVAATVGMAVGILLGFTSGYLGGRVDDVIRTLADVTITIPALMILVVINALLRQIDIMTMALLIALFIWPSPTRWGPNSLMPWRSASTSCSAASPTTTATAYTALHGTKDLGRFGLCYLVWNIPQPRQPKCKPQKQSPR